MLSSGVRLRDRYRILRHIGGGGFGDVYEAVDEVFGCSVALKETKEAIAGADKLRRAFEREAKLLRSLKHDSLPRVTDYFFHDGAQFLVMDFIDGTDLAALLRERLRQQHTAFTCEEVLPWIDKVLDALEYLHSRPEKIIHRDIKPANIKLTTDGGIYLLDFGLAKGAAGQMSTVVEGQTSSSVPGFTREYAPLEQLQDTGALPQTDIYSVGATLYHLLAGQLPLSASLRDDAIQHGRGDPLRPAHEVNPAISKFISEVVSQALEVRWWDRLDSAAGMRALLRQARQKIAPTLSPSEPRPTGEAPPLNSTAPAISENPQPTPTQTDAPDSKPSTLPLRQPPILSSPPGPASSSQPQPQPTAPSRSRRLWLALGVAALVLAGSAALIRYNFFGGTKPSNDSSSTNQLASPPNTSPAISPAQNIKATPVTLSLKKELETSTTIWAVAFAPDGNTIASAGEDGTIILWDTKTWTHKEPLRGHKGAVYSLAFSPDSQILASAGKDKTIKLWDARTGQLAPVSLPPEHSDEVLSMAFAPNGKLFASAGKDKTLRLWDLSNGWKPRPLVAHTDEVLAIAFSADSSTLASTGYDGRLLLWDVRGGGEPEELKPYPRALYSIAFSPDGKYLVCGGEDGFIKRWSRQSQSGKWEELVPLEGHTDWARSLAVSPDSKALVSVGKDKRILLWNLQSGAHKLLDERVKGTRAVAFSPDGQTLISGGKDKINGGEDKTIKVWQ